MASKRAPTSKKKPLLATLVTDKRSPCAFCQRDIDDEITYGKHYAIGDIQCHYFCALLSCCLIQKGKDEEGLFGFLYPDIVAEVERSKKHRCSYCSKGGANLGCCVSHCRKQFHLPCGRQHGAVSLFYGNYKSFCIEHAPRQKIPEHIMGPARLREKRAKAQTLKAPPSLASLKELQMGDGATDSPEDTESVCVICYEAVTGLSTPNTFWPPCCARDAWFHRSCLQRMALSAGMHYLKCPLCNDKEQFYEAVVDQGYYVPDRDAAWELEQNAFAEIYERPLACSADDCSCPNGRSHDADSGPWDIKLCILCGTLGIHASCLADNGIRGRFVCATCLPQAPADIDSLILTIEREILEEQARRATETKPSGPLMPSRMSLRRTKPRPMALPSTSSARKTEAVVQASPTQNTTSSRLDLNLKTPRRTRNSDASEVPISPILSPNLMVNVDKVLLTPLKMLQQGFTEKIQVMGVKEVPVVNPDKVLDELRQTFKKPRPLCAKRRVVNAILEGLFDNVLKDGKNKDPVKEWNSPKKSFEPYIANTEAENKENAPSDEDIRIDNEDHSDSLLSLKMSNTVTTPNKKCYEAKSGPVSEILEIIGETKSSPVGKILEIIEDDSDDIFENEPEFAIKIKAEMAERNSPLKLKACTKSSKMADVLPLKMADVSTPNKMADDDSSRSTFELPPEFIADNVSDEDASFLDAPKKLKTVNMEKDSSLEISNNDAIVNIDLVKVKESSNIEVLNKVDITHKHEKCLVKFSPIVKETLELDAKVKIDLESFKNHYLNEIGKSYEQNKCTSNIESVINAVVDASMSVKEVKRMKGKRKARSKDVIAKKRRKRNKSEEIELKSDQTKDKSNQSTGLKTKEVVSEDVGNKRKNHNNRPKTAGKRENSKTKKISTKEMRKKSQHKKFALKFEGKSDKGSDLEIVCSKNGGQQETIDLTVDTAEKGAKRRRKFKNRKNRENIRVKIRLRDDSVKLRITKSDGKITKKNRNKQAKCPKTPESPTKLKQYILKYPTEQSSTMICKPDIDITPKKRNYLKLEKSPDNLIQTSIQSFFKVTPQHTK